MRVLLKREIRNFKLLINTCIFIVVIVVLLRMVFKRDAVPLKDTRGKRGFETPSYNRLSSRAETDQTTRLRSGIIPVTDQHAY